jgi:DNA polymerase III alpha subunit (gram-positive type)
MRCPLCKVANLVSISMTVSDRQLTMHSCSRCETKWWDADGENVGLATVLGFTAETRRRPRRRTA